MKKTKEQKMRIVIVKDRKEILKRKFSPVEQSLGIISLEKFENRTDFTVRVLDVNHLRYHYDPKTQKFEVHFLSLKKEEKKRGVKNHEPIQTRF